MNAKRIMDLYAKYERKTQVEKPHAKRVADDNIVKYIYEGGGTGFISYFNAASLTIDDLIKREIAYFTAINQSFEWKVYGTDLPEDIGERLVAYGFTAEQSESFMARDIRDYHPNLTTPDGVKCRAVTSKQMFRDAFNIQNTEFPLDVNEHVEDYWSKYQADKNCTIYVVYEGNKPVSSARLDLTPDSIFAGMWAGTTLKEFRGKGHYQVLLNYRIHEAKLTGYQYMTIDALGTSRPIVEKHGFELITTTTPYIFTPNKRNAELC